MRKMPIQTSRMKTGLKDLCDQIVNACPVFAVSNQHLLSRIVHLANVCKDFRQRIQTNFVFADIRGTKHCALHIKDAESRDSDSTIDDERFAVNMVSTMETS